MFGLKTNTYAKISPEMENPRDIAGNAEEEEEVGMSLIKIRTVVRNCPIDHDFSFSSSVFFSD